MGVIIYSFNLNISPKMSNGVLVIVLCDRTTYDSLLMTEFL